LARKTIEGLGPGTLIPQRGKLPLNDPRLGAEEGFVLSRIDGRTSLEEVLLLVPFDEEVVMLLLRKLWEMGAIDVPGLTRPEPKPEPAKPPQEPAKPPVIPAPSGDRGNLSDDQVRRIDELFHVLETRTAFELLGVTRNADVKEIKRAYFKLSKEFHPDRFYTMKVGDYGKKLTLIFQAVKNAFEILSDEKRKAAYIESLD
jgi:hypothetical protein